MRPRRRASSRRVLFTLALMLLGCGPDDEHEGRLSADAPIIAPISGSAACIVRLEVDDGRARRGGGIPYVGPRHARGLRFHIAGRSLVVSTEDGDLQPGRDGRVDYGRPSYRRGAMYQAGLWGVPRPAPTALAEWGAASRALCFGGGSPVDCARKPRWIRITEQFAPCDQPVRLRGSIVGDRFVLRDTTVGSVQRAFTFMGGLTCCSLAAVSLFIGALILGATAAVRGFLRIVRRRGSAPPRPRTVVRGRVAEVHPGEIVRVVELLRPEMSWLGRVEAELRPRPWWSRLRFWVREPTDLAVHVRLIMWSGVSQDAEELLFDGNQLFAAGKLIKSALYEAGHTRPIRIEVIGVLYGRTWFWL